MSMKCKIDHVLGRVYTEAIGEITYETVKNHFREKISEECEHYPELIDATKAEAGFSIEEARSIATVIKRLGAKNKIAPAAIIAANDLTFGMSRMIGILVDDVCSIGVFRDETEAEKWLNREAIKTGLTHSLGLVLGGISMSI